MTSELIAAIENHDKTLIKELLGQGACVNGNSEFPLISYVLDEIEDSGWGLDIFKLFLKLGANVDHGAINHKKRSTLITATDLGEIEVIQLLLEFGSDVGLVDAEGDNALSISFWSCSIEIADLLLKYGAQSQINEYKSFSVYTPLERAIKYCGIDMVKILLDHGADVSVPSEFNELMISVLEKSEIEYSKQDYKQLKNLLNPTNPPYLKVEQKKEHKYIIYENKEGNPYLLGFIDKEQDKKYLYHNFEPGFFLIWSAKNNLLENTLKTTIFSMIDKLGYPSCHEAFMELMKNTIGTTLTTDYFTEDGKAFAIGYLTVTNWWYSLHYDLTKLFPVENGFAQVPETDEAYSIIEKLLDKRYEQFRSGKHFNSNQKPEELRSLLEVV